MTLASWRQRNVCSAGVLAGDGPGGLAMADEMEHGKRHVVFQSGYQAGVCSGKSMNSVSAVPM